MQAKEPLVVTRLIDEPIISAATHPGIGENIQGPSLIRVPDWIKNPLGKYYLYFADHKGGYIRLAYADELIGPWKLYAPGSLQLEESHFPIVKPSIPPGGMEKVEAWLEKSGMDMSNMEHDIMVDLVTPHIASPDVHVNHENKTILMYFHGLESFANQVSRVAVSKDGVHFKALPEIIGRTYMRVFETNDWVYSLAMPGVFYRSKNGLNNFEEGPTLFNPNMRHSAVLLREEQLYIFWTQVGDEPERILLSKIDISKPWKQWKTDKPVEVIRPERKWEGANEPIKPSVRSVAYNRVNQLRDPAIFTEKNKVYLLYAIAGESGIAIAQLFFSNN